LGLIDDLRWDAFNRKRDAVGLETERLKSTWVNPRQLPEADAVRVLGQPMEREYRLFDLLRRPEVSYASLLTLPGAGDAVTAPDVVEQVEIQAKYQGYIERQKDEVEKSLAHESMPLPSDIDYAEVHGLSFEVRQKLAQGRPQTLGQASRLQGMTPAAISLLLVHLKRRKAA
jgi:tRNA uridine 5-carboxymethylaminomethyl modification enzyme